MNKINIFHLFLNEFDALTLITIFRFFFIATQYYVYMDSNILKCIRLRP